jgi:hypothetical protein
MLTAVGYPVFCGKTTFCPSAGALFPTGVGQEIPPSNHPHPIHWPHWCQMLAPDWLAGWMFNFFSPALCLPGGGVGPLGCWAWFTHSRRQHGIETSLSVQYSFNVYFSNPLSPAASFAISSIPSKASHYSMISEYSMMQVYIQYTLFEPSENGLVTRSDAKHIQNIVPVAELGYILNIVPVAELGIYPQYCPSCRARDISSILSQ